MNVIGRGKSVLIVDDEQHIRQLVSTILKAAGFSVIEAANGKDALDKLTDTEIGMVITDLRMPQMDGIEFVKVLRSRSRYSDVPVVMITSDFLGYKSAQAEQAGVSEWITKPFITQQLIHTVRRLGLA